MGPIVLIAYATRMGSTEEVALKLAEALRGKGWTADVQPAKAIRSLEPYSAVVLGAALYMGRLHKDARRFLTTHRDALLKLPVSLFVLGPVQNDEMDWTGARQQLEREFNRFPWFHPVVQSLVGGKFDPAKLGFPFSLIPALRKMPPSDVRNWAAVQAFGDDLVAKLHPAP